MIGSVLVARTGAITSLGLLSLALTGPWTAPRHEPSPMDGLVGYDFTERDPRELIEALKSGAPGEHQDPTSLNRLVFESIAHGTPARVTWEQNWLAWSLGHVLPDAALTQSPARIAHSGIGLCDDAVGILLAITKHHGFQGEMVELNGHLVAELTRNGMTWMADPDFGLVFPGSVAEYESAAGCTEVYRAVVGAGFEEAHADAYVEALGSPEDNAPVPMAVLSPRLASTEATLDVLAWLIPALLAGVFSVLSWRAR